MKVLITGSSGFLGSYMVQEFIDNGHVVIGVDLEKVVSVWDYWSSDGSSFIFVQGNAKNFSLMKNLIEGCDVLIANAAKVGGIGYFHLYPYTIIRENELLTKTAFDAAIWAYRRSSLKKIILISSSMIYESAISFPTKEGDEYFSFPPKSVYGFQKLTLHFWAKAAYEQYNLPYVIIIPFNAYGIGERIDRVGLKSHLSHVIPDLIVKIHKSDAPVRILGDGNQIRHFTYAGDIAKAVRLIAESDIVNEEFNVSYPYGMKIIELAQKIWKKIKSTPLKCEFVKGYPYDVKKRIPDTRKLSELIGFIPETKLDDKLEELIKWYTEQIL